MSDASELIVCHVSISSRLCNLSNSSKCPPLVCQVAEKETERLRLEQYVARLEALLDETVAPPTPSVATSGTDNLDSAVSTGVTRMPSDALTCDSATSILSVESGPQLSSGSAASVSPLQLISALQSQMQGEFDERLDKLHRTGVDGDLLEASVVSLHTEYKVWSRSNRTTVTT